MNYELTIFKNQFDNKTHRTMEFSTWGKFQSLLEGLSLKEGQKGGNNSSPLITPARYFPDTTRSNKNVDYWGGWAAVDVDDFVSFSDVSSSDVMPSLQKICGRYEFVCYSTASSTPIQPKFRLVFPLTSVVTSDDIPHFWYALNKQLQGIGDKQTKDLSRMYYVPAEYPEAFNFIFSNSGQHICPENLMEAWPYEKPKGNNFLDKLPEALRNEVINYRKEQANNTDISWVSYHDCPFFPKSLAREYMVITSTGWYHKMYQIMVAIAGNAIKAEYPITPKQIADLCRELDRDNGMWYDNRPLEVEANSAIEYVYRN